MAFWDSYDACMAAKGLPLLGEIFSRKTFGEAIDLLEQIHQAVEAAGGVEVTAGGLVALGPGLGLSAEALEVLGVIAGATVNIAMHLYISEAIGCMGTAAIQDNLLSEAESAGGGFVKDQVISAASAAA